MRNNSNFNKTIQDLKEQGYSREFSVSDLRYLQPENWCVEQVVRFEDGNNVVNSTAVYALYQHNGGRRGILVNNYRSDSEVTKNEFLNHIPLTGAIISRKQFEVVDTPDQL